MFEVRFESTTGTRWRIGWWLATIGAWLMVVGFGGAVVGPLLSARSEGTLYFAIGVATATVGFFAFIAGRNLMLKRIVTQVIDNDSHEAD